MTATEFISRYGTEKDVQEEKELHYLCVSDAQRHCISMVIMEKVINSLNQNQNET